MDHLSIQGFIFAIAFTSNHAANNGVIVVALQFTVTKTQPLSQL